MSLNFVLTCKGSSVLQQFSVSSQRKKVYIRCELLSVIYGALMIEVSGFMTDLLTAITPQTLMQLITPL